MSIAPTNKIHTVFLKGKGYVLGFDVKHSPLGQCIVRSNYVFDQERAVFLSEKEANEIVQDIKGAVCRPMVVKPQETPN